MSKDIKTERIIELFGEEYIGRINMFRIQVQLGYPSSRDFWITTPLSADEIRYVLTYLSYRLRKIKSDTHGLWNNMEILQDILYKCYGCAGYIPYILPLGGYVAEAHIDVSMADNEAWKLCKDGLPFPSGSEFPSVLTETDSDKYLKKMI